MNVKEDWTAKSLEVLPVDFESEDLLARIISGINQSRHEALTLLGFWKSQRFSNKV